MTRVLVDVLGGVNVNNGSFRNIRIDFYLGIIDYLWMFIMRNKKNLLIV